MNYDINDLHNELARAVDIARRAGREAMRFYKSSLDVQHKGDIKEPVTQADYAANNVIVAALTREFPDDGLLSEETPDTARRLSKRRVWMIDPLDGTQGFIDCNGDFAVQIGLTIEGVPHLGVVYQPAQDITYYATKGGGCRTQRGDDGQASRLRVSDIKDLREIRLAASRSHRSPRMTRIVEEMGFKSEINRGSVGVKVGLIVTAECDLYVHLSPRTKQWDTCAPEIILTEAGGKVTDIFGDELNYNTPDVWNHNGIVASNGACQAEVVARLAPLLSEFGRKPHA